MRIILTGSAGFIGSHLSKALTKRGHEVYGIDKKINVDISNFERLSAALEGYEPDIIIHLAANCSTQRGIDNPLNDFRDNALGSINMLEIARVTGAQFIYASTCKVHPVQGKIRTPYGLSKYIGEQYALEYSNLFGIEFIANRMGTIYGPGQDASPESGWLSWFIRCHLENLPLTVFGNGEQIRDVLYIDDVVKLYVDQVEHFEDYANKIYDVGGGFDNALTLNRVIKHLGITNLKYGKRRPGDADVYISTNADVKRVRRWKPKTNWQNGIRKTIEYYKSK